MDLGKDSCQTPKYCKPALINWPFLISLLLLALIAVFSVYNEQTPSPLPAHAPDHQFSAGRAYQTIQSIYLNSLPHPTGSLAQQQIGDRLIQYFRKIGYNPEVQEVLVSSRTTHTCAVVRNIIARTQGVHDDRGILVTAHYDSVPCGPGGMDDGVGVAAVLELARVLREGSPPDCSIMFLLSDGEELGLLGAKAFVEQHPWARNIQFVIGVDSGGDGGRSRVTEISGDKEILIRTISGRLKRPSGSSAIVAVLNAFNYVEGTSDFEEFKRDKKTGINLINSAWNYQRHTPHDNIKHINLGTLQEHGDHLLDIVNSLRNSIQVDSERDEVIFFDLFGRWIIYYSRFWAWVLQIITLMMFGLIWKRLKWDSPLIGLQSLGKWILVIVAGTIGGGMAGSLLVRLPQMPFLIKPALILFTAVWIEILAFRYLKVEGSAAWIAWNILGLVTCIWLPGASYLLTIPALGMGLISLTYEKTTENCVWWSYLWPFGLATLLWLPLFYVLIEFGSPFYLLSIPILILSELILPIFEGFRMDRYRLASAGLLVLIILGPIYLWIKPTQPRPRDYANIYYVYQTNQRQAHWLLPIRSVPGVWKAAGHISVGKIDNPMIRVSGKIPMARAPRLNLHPPVAVIKSDVTIPGRKRRLVIYLRSQSKARVLKVAIRPRPYEARVNGLLITPTPLSRTLLSSFTHRDPWERYQFIGKITHGMILELKLPPNRKVDFLLMDQIDGLPSLGEKLIKARPNNVLPVQDGDLTLLMRRYRFNP